MKNKRNWSNSEMRSLTRGEAMHHFSKGEHYYVDKDWYIWFLGNATRYAIFHTFLWKYGNGEMVSYTDLTRTEKIGSQRLKIDSIPKFFIIVKIADFKELARAGMKFDWLESINKFVSLFAETAKNAFGQDQLPNVIPIKKGKKRG